MRIHQYIIRTVSNPVSLFHLLYNVAMTTFFKQKVPPSSCWPAPEFFMESCEMQSLIRLFIVDVGSPSATLPHIPVVKNGASYVLVKHKGLGCTHRQTQPFICSLAWLWTWQKDVANTCSRSCSVFTGKASLMLGTMWSPLSTVILSSVSPAPVLMKLTISGWVISVTRVSPTLTWGTI